MIDLSLKFRCRNCWTFAFLTLMWIQWPFSILIPLEDWTAISCSSQVAGQEQRPPRSSNIKPEEDQQKKSGAIRRDRTGTGKQSLTDLAQIGLDRILNQSYFPAAEFDQETFDEIWRAWPADLSEQAGQLTPDERRRMAFRRYGLTPRDDDPTKPLQYVVDKNGSWSMNCMACHGGSLYGSEKSYPGLPNNRIALETLYEDVRKTKRILKKPLSPMDYGSSLVPMGTTVGTSNAVIFGVALMALRDNDLNLKSFVIPPIVVHHDMDAPAWWHYKQKKMLYIDGFTARQHRSLVPFIMVRENSGEKIRGLEPDFQAIEEFIKSVRPPKYSRPIDRKKAKAGAKIFEHNCAHCHGTYDDDLSYPEVTVDLSEIGTDRVRKFALSKSYRKRYGESWLAGYGASKTISDPKGYVAPPLTGIWATAPYLHNGSVPTLRGILRSQERPTVWKREKDGFNEQDVGLITRSLQEVPSDLDSAERRRFFDTRKRGKSNSGHRYGDHLKEEELVELLEYLKTL